MKDLQHNRRAQVPAGAADTLTIEAEEIVRQGLLVQAASGTRSAIEFLKANDIDGAVIGRVLAGGPLRGEDREALADHVERRRAGA